MTSRSRLFPIVTSLLAFWFSLSMLQLPACAQSGSFDTSKVHQNITSSSKSDHSSLPSGADEDMQASFGIPGLLLSRRYHLTMGSRVVVAPKHGSRIKGRKMLFGTRGCASQDLTLTQGPVSSTSGIPTFSVQILNLCGTCSMGDIHVACGNWASATPVDPFIFSRLGYNDCLVNNGKPLGSQGSISFQYSNSAMYPMSITSAVNECGP